MGTTTVTTPTVATNTSLMPFAGEVGLAQYINRLFGGGPNMGNLSLAGTPTLPGAAQVATPEDIVANTQAELTPEQLNQLMTEWLRGAGNFTGAAREQNLSGMYNTATRNLVSNDLMAQAALKATQANTPIKTANAQILNQVAQANAALKQNAATANAQLLQQNQTANANLATQIALENARTQNTYNVEQAKLKAATPSTGVLAGALGISALQSILNYMNPKQTGGGGGGTNQGGLLEQIFGPYGGTTAQQTAAARKKREAELQGLADEELAALKDTGDGTITPDSTRVQEMQDMLAEELSALSADGVSPVQGYQSDYIQSPVQSDYGLQQASFSPADMSGYFMPAVDTYQAPDYGYYSDYNINAAPGFEVPSFSPMDNYYSPDVGFMFADSYQPVDYGGTNWADTSWEDAYTGNTDYMDSGSWSYFG